MDMPLLNNKVNTCKAMIIKTSSSSSKSNWICVMAMILHYCYQNKEFSISVKSGVIKFSKCNGYSSLNYFFTFTFIMFRENYITLNLISVNWPFALLLVYCKFSYIRKLCKLEILMLLIPSFINLIHVTSYKKF